MQPFIQAVPQLADIAAYHADTPEVGGVAKRAGVRTLILTHLLPETRNHHDKQGFIYDVRAGGFYGDLIVADAGETVRF